MGWVSLGRGSAVKGAGLHWFACGFGGRHGGEQGVSAVLIDDLLERVPPCHFGADEVEEAENSLLRLVREADCKQFHLHLPVEVLGRVVEARGVELLQVKRPCGCVFAIALSRVFAEGFVLAPCFGKHWCAVNGTHGILKGWKVIGAAHVGAVVICRDAVSKVRKQRGEPRVLACVGVEYGGESEKNLMV